MYIVKIAITRDTYFTPSIEIANYEQLENYS